MTKIPKDIFFPLNAGRTLKDNTNSIGVGIPNSSISLKEWLGETIQIGNGIIFNPTTLKFELGGNITEDTQIQIATGVNFVIAGTNGNGLFQIDDSGNAIFLGSLATSTGINIYPDIVNLTSPDELNIISNNLTIRDTDGDAYFVLEKIGSDTIMKSPNLVAYADDAAAGVGGVGTGEWFLNSTTGAISVKS